MSAPITHVFVLMLENRSFDHLLGFSGLSGTDAQTGEPTQIDGLSGDESNLGDGTPYTVSQPALWTMPVDPGHEFADTLIQLCGSAATYLPGGAYPAIDNSGFVADYIQSPTPDEGDAPGDYGAIMQACSSAQIPVLTALAENFAVCDHWFSSMPGPTWPNRFFLYAASSGGLDHTPSIGEIGEWSSVHGFKFPNGSIFDALNTLDFGARIYADGAFTVVGALKGITGSDINDFADFASDIQNPAYPYPYTFIEPNYGDLLDGTYLGGTSQHPLDGVTGGEGLIKAVYEAIRNSPLWNSSLLIVTWDEHGGFYDHAAPPAAPAPNDGSPSTYNQSGFTFEQYGVRVPAVVVSPWIAKNLIDHRLYDHSSVPAMLEQLFGLPPLTARDAAAASPAVLATLDAPRSDAPTQLPNPASPPPSPRAAPQDDRIPLSMQGFLYVAMKHESELEPERQAAIVSRVAAIRTRAQAQQYMQDVAAKLRVARGKEAPKT